MRAAGFTQTEFDKLAQAENDSDLLAKIQTKAMSVVKNTRGSALGSFSVGEKADIEVARSLMYSNDYLTSKAKILATTDDSADACLLYTSDAADE